MGLEGYSPEHLRRKYGFDLGLRKVPFFEKMIEKVGTGTEPFRWVEAPLFEESVALSEVAIVFYLSKLPRWECMTEGIFLVHQEA